VNRETANGKRETANALNSAFGPPPRLRQLAEGGEIQSRAIIQPVNFSTSLYQLYQPCQRYQLPSLFFLIFSFHVNMSTCKLVNFSTYFGTKVAATYLLLK
jgi:hypothetical protein